MERSQRERLTEELTLVLLYLTSFTEKQCPNVRMAWKTHDWTALDDLAEIRRSCRGRFHGSSAQQKKLHSLLDRRRC